MRMQLEIMHNDGRVSYDFTNVEYSSVQECQAAYNLMVAKGTAGNIMFQAFSTIRKIVVTEGKM